MRSIAYALGFALALATLLAWTGSARAQAPPPAPPPPPAAAPVITPPVLKMNEGAVYPEEALKAGIHEKVTVTLVLEIDAEGAVKSATVDKPVGHGFDEAAVDAAKRLVFAPATRDGRPVPSKIRFNYEFPPPPAVLAGRLFERSTGAPIAGATVTVTGPDGSPHTAMTDEGGRWRVGPLPAGTYHVTASADGRIFSSDEEATAGSETNVIYRLEPKVAAPLPVEGADAGAVEQVEVRGEKPPREVVKRTLEQRELNRIPGTNGDALRSLQNLPGVARPPGFAGLLIVRGSNPNDTQIFVDGTPIPIVYHFGGLSSVIPTEMLEKIDFYPGNFSAQYGRAQAGIVDVGLRDPKKDGQYHGLAQADFIDARVMAEGPVPLLDGWNFLVGGRRSYVDLWLKPVLEKTTAGVSAAPVYYDYQAELEKDLSKNSSIRFTFFGSDDDLALILKTVSTTDPSFGGGISTHTGFWRGQARFKDKLGPDTDFKLVGSFGSDYVDFSLGDDFFTLTTYPVSGRAELSQKVAKGVVANVGFDMLYVPYSVDVRAPPRPIAGQPPPGPFGSRPPVETKVTDQLYEPAMYSELEIVPWTGGRIVPGLRLDYTKDTKAWDLAPRVTVRQDLTSDFPRTTAKGGVGVFFQPPQPQETNAVFGTPGLVSNRALQYDVDAEQEFTHNIDASLDLWYKELDTQVTAGVGSVGSGYAYGAETLIRYKPDARFFGWIAYTLSRSMRRDTPTDPLRFAHYDQTHILTVLGSYRLGHGWEMGARYRFVSGSMDTPETYGFYDENGGVSLPLASYPAYGTRLPAFHALDIRLDKTWKFKSWLLSVYLDIENVYNQGNVEGTAYNYNYTRETYITGLPIIPSLGVRGEF
jgi:TonB family protein